MWDNPRGQLPGTGIRSDGENLYGGNLYGGSAQGVSGTSSGSVAVAGESSSGGLSLQGNVSGGGSGGASSGGQVSACAVQEIVFHFSILLQQLYHHWVQQNGMKLSLWGLLNF